MFFHVCRRIKFNNRKRKDHGKSTAVTTEWLHKSTIKSQEKVEKYESFQKNHGTVVDDCDF